MKNPRKSEDQKAERGGENRNLKGRLSHRLFESLGDLPKS